MKDSIKDILQECLDLVRQGASIEECLARYPRYAQEIEPLLRTSLLAQEHLAPEMPVGAKNRVRGRVLAEWDRARVKSSRRWNLPSLMPRWAAVSIFLVLAIALGGTGTVAASGGAIPGDTLYPVKEFREETQLWFARSPEARVATSTRFVRERLEELRALTAAGETTRTSVALDRLEGHVNRINREVDTMFKQAGGPPTQTDIHLLDSLKNVMANQQLAESLIKDFVIEAPPETLLALHRDLEAIQGGRKRVQDALEAIQSP